MAEHEGHLMEMTVFTALTGYSQFSADAVLLATFRIASPNQQVGRVRGKVRA